MKSSRRQPGQEPSDLSPADEPNFSYDDNLEDEEVEFEPVGPDADTREMPLSAFSNASRRKDI